MYLEVVKVMYTSFSGVISVERQHTQLWYKKPPEKYTREGSYHILIFPTRRVRALKIGQINSAILKVPDAALIR